MRRSVLLAVLALALAGNAAVAQAPAEPPFSGTIFIDGDIITPADPSALRSVRSEGRGRRTMFDRRRDAFRAVRARLFAARYRDGVRVEVQVNPELGGRRAAARQARKYARAVGRLPHALRADVDMLWIHAGKELYGGGNRSILIHTGMTPEYERDRILEETLAHEAAHTSLDSAHAAAPGWLAAQEADPTFISTYARDNPEREDIAESFVPYLGVRYRRERMDPDAVESIEAAIPNRIAYFDAQGFDVRPIARGGAR